MASTSVSTKKKKKESRAGGVGNVGLVLNENMEKTDDLLAGDMGQPESWWNAAPDDD